jgi:hypothetical protein
MAAWSLFVSNLLDKVYGMLGMLNEFWQTKNFLSTKTLLLPNSSSPSHESGWLSFLICTCLTWWLLVRDYMGFLHTVRTSMNLVGCPDLIWRWKSIMQDSEVRRWQSGCSDVRARSFQAKKTRGRTVGVLVSQNIWKTLWILLGFLSWASELTQWRLSYLQARF